MSDTPPEPILEAAARDGQRMLEMLKAAQRPVILGEDGKPIEAPRIQEPVDEKAEIERARKRVDENAARINELIEGSAAVKKCTDTILAAYQLVFWSLSELGAHEGFTDELIDQVSASMRNYAVGRRYTLNEVLRKLQHLVLPYMRDRAAVYHDEMNRRAEALKRARMVLGEAGIALPCHSLRQLCKNGRFDPGAVMVLYGQYDAVRAALQMISRLHLKQGGNPYYLSDREGEKEGSWCEHVMPPAWWHGTGSPVARLHDALYPALQGSSLLVLVERLEEVMPDKAVVHAKNKALGKLLEWADCNMVGMVVGDVLAAGEMADMRLYGVCPHIPVSLSEMDGKRKLVVGSDVLDLEAKE
jgi:hypothetical protein